MAPQAFGTDTAAGETLTFIACSDFATAIPDEFRAGVHAEGLIGFSAPTAVDRRPLS